MWNAIVDKLKRLKSIDRQCQAFGAGTHEYFLRPCLSTSALNTVERRLGTVLPSALRSFYAEVGDGVAGPYYGLKPGAELTGYHTDRDYPGIEVLKQVAAAEGTPPDERGYFEVSHDALAGLLSVIDEGCGHEVCLMTTGSKSGNVVYVSADGYVVETQKRLTDIYTEWVDDEIKRFGAVRVLMEAGMSFEQIQSEMIGRFQDYNAGDRIASIADVSKPASLFGEGNHWIYHGATQHPWYEQVLKDWQRGKRNNR
jgi:hypothetical protein